MNLIKRIFLLPGLFFLIAFLNCQQKHPLILIQTEIGDIKVELYPRQAPITASNFLRYVDENRFEASSFYRVVRLDNQSNEVKIEVIQGGLGFGESERRLPPISHETTAETGILHEDGVISMARDEPGTAASEFFICIGDQPELDFGGKRNPDGQGFAAFGRVIGSMDVVRKILQQPAHGQMLQPEIRIEKIIRSSTR